MIKKNTKTKKYFENKAVLMGIDNIFCFVIITIANLTALSAFAGTAVFIYE